ncbi:hypothetical protein D3C73_1007680 [compost metagenome]
MRELADAGECFRIKVYDPLDQIVGTPCPNLRGGLVTDMRRHRRGTGRKNRHVGAAFAQQPQLVGLDRLADLIVRYVGIGRVDVAATLDGVFLLRAPFRVGGRRGRIMAVAIDDHVFGIPPTRASSRHKQSASQISK